MSETTDQLLAMSKAQNIAEQTIGLLSREKQVLQESVNRLEQQLSSKTVEYDVAKTQHQSELNRLHHDQGELKEQEESKQYSLGLLKVSNAKLTELVDSLTMRVNDLEARNMKLLSEKQDSLGLLKLSNTKKLTELVNSLTAHVTDLEARNNKLLSEKQGSPELLKQLYAKKLTEIIDKLTAHVTDLEARNSELLSEKQKLLTDIHQLEEKKQMDLKLNKKKMEILDDIKIRRSRR